MANYHTIFHGITGPLAVKRSYPHELDGLLGPLTPEQVNWVEEVAHNLDSICSLHSAGQWLSCSLGFILLTLHHAAP